MSEYVAGFMTCFLGLVVIDAMNILWRRGKR